jgi:hypothetical protein
MSPLTYALNVSVLPNYVLLGMPATESSNALILPLTGHELGHSVWTNENLENRWAAPVQKKVYEYIKKEKSSAKSTTDFLIVDEISKIALAQMEEVFCDAIGLIIFGESFVHAFHYLLAPGWGGERPLYYPALPTRAKFMVDHGGIDFSAIGYANFPLEFMERQPRLSSDQNLILNAADFITDSVAGELYKEATKKVLNDIPDLISDNNANNEIIHLFKKGIPARRPRSLPDILNAGWQYVLEEGKTYEADGRPIFEWASELVLKSIEVLEFRRRLDA